MPKQEHKELRDCDVILHADEVVFSENPETRVWIPVSVCNALIVRPLSGEKPLLVAYHFSMPASRLRPHIGADFRSLRGSEAAKIEAGEAVSTFSVPFEDVLGFTYDLLKRKGVYGVRQEIVLLPNDAAKGEGPNFRFFQDAATELLRQGMCQKVTVAEPAKLFKVSVNGGEVESLNRLPKDVFVAGLNLMRQKRGQD